MLFLVLVKIQVFSWTLGAQYKLIEVQQYTNRFMEGNSSITRRKEVHQCHNQPDTYCTVALYCAHHYYSSPHAPSPGFKSNAPPCAQATVEAGVFPRQNHSLINSRGLVYVFGGIRGGVATSDLFAFNLTGRRWLTCKANTPCGAGPGAHGNGTEASWPPARHNHISATIKGVLVVLGGIGAQGQPLGDMWTYDAMTSVWSLIPLKSGNSLTETALIFPLHPGVATLRDENGATVLVLVGGQNANGQCLSTVWVIDPIVGSFRQISSSLPPMKAPLATSMANTGVIPSMLSEVVVLLGGQGCGTSEPIPSVVAIDTTGKVATLGDAPGLPLGLCAVGMGSGSTAMTLTCPSASFRYSLGTKTFREVMNYTGAPAVQAPFRAASLFHAELAVLDASGALWALDPFQCPYNCSGFGSCVDGACMCHEEWQGAFCEEVCRSVPSRVLLCCCTAQRRPFGVEHVISCSTLTDQECVETFRRS